MKTDEELRELAMHVHTGAVFCDAHIPQGERVEMVPSIFLPVALGCEIPEETCMAYESMDKAGTRSINGYPIFMSVNFLVRDEYERFRTFYIELQEPTNASETP